MVKNRKGLCIGSMILGIISVLMCAIQPFVFVASIVGIIIGIVGLRTTDGKGMAIAGIIMSSVGALIGALIMFLVVGAVGIIDNAVDYNSPNGGFHFYYENNYDKPSDEFEFHIDEGPLDNVPLEIPDNDSNLI